MEGINYVGETLWIHYLGHFLILLSFVASGFAVFSYFKDTQESKSTGISGAWKTLGRYGFVLHSLSIVSVIAMIFYAMGAQMYEYSYVFQHVNSELPSKYIFSAFWEGQEGSFLLWMFWHVILGIVVMWKAGKWESPVLTIVALAQLLINLMILGIHLDIGDFSTRIGSNPIVLLRQTMDIPLFANAEYLDLIEGNGLNPLLQNYWNTIHPPVLFLGFASVLIPFGYAIAGMWTQDHKGWLKPGLNWSLFSASVFGIGILMGSAWAYEALTFGGYWAWDPVENSSFVPWLTMVAAVHTHLIAKNTGYSLRSTYFLYVLSFVLVLYSTFLTRSGILGDTSAHAFTEMGLETQLTLLVSVFFILGFGVFSYRYKSIPEPKREESIYSREFWMFIGALVLLFSSLIIIGSTSLPVFNKIVEYFNPGYEGLVIQDIVYHYNKYQVWISIFVSILASTAVFLRYRSLPITGKKLRFLLFRLGISAIIALFLTFLFESWLDLYIWQYAMLAFFGFFLMSASIIYMIQALKENIRLGASGFSHFGFALLIIGVLASGLNKSHISTDPFGQRGLMSEDDLSKFVLLYENSPLMMNGYEMEYKGNTMEERERFFDVEFTRLDNNNQVLDKFSLNPSVLLSNDKTKVNAQIPSTKHYWNKDIFTNIVGLPAYMRDVEEAQTIEDTLNYKTYYASLGDTFQINDIIGKLESVTYQPSNPNFDPENSDFAVGLDLTFHKAGSDSTYKVQPVLSLDKALIITLGELINPLGIKIRVNDTLMNDLIKPASDLEYQTYTIQSGDVINHDGVTISLKGFTQDITSRLYKAKEGDIAVAAQMTIDGDIDASPVFLIRDGQPMHFDEFIPEKNIHVRFVNIDPNTEEFTFLIARDKLVEDFEYPIEVAENAPRNDWIYLEARLFPGINLFWAGSIFMMLGFLWALIARVKSKA